MLLSISDTISSHSPSCSFLWLPCLHLNIWNKCLAQDLCSGCCLFQAHISPGVILYTSVSFLTSLQIASCLLALPEHSVHNKFPSYSLLCICFCFLQNKTSFTFRHKIDLFEYHLSPSLDCGKSVFQHLYLFPICAWGMLALNIKYFSNI